VEEFRQSIEKWVKPTDFILEIGCEWGTTSTLIHEKCKNLTNKANALETEKDALNSNQVCFTIMLSFSINLHLKASNCFLLC
jgi:cyclopropane fatty-acyl-phospholipid synthase-like methyltransferase